MSLVEIYTDGSATTKDKPGGWAYVIVVDGEKHSEGYGHLESATNNDAELQGAIEGLASALKNPIPGNHYVLVSDSEIILGWASGNYKFKQTKKLDKYNILKQLMSRLHASTRWVKGHSGNPHNERCDELANLGRKQLPIIEPTLSDSKIGNKKIGVVCLHYKGKLKVIDLDNSIIEDYNKEIHGRRGSILEIREDKTR